MEVFVQHPDTGKKFGVPVTGRLMTIDDFISAMYSASNLVGDEYTLVYGGKRIHAKTGKCHKEKQDTVRKERSF